ncbi:hypothetical protein [Nostoc sp.]|uniref:hypothetical protein n=1 Tax=Nostoc sp. TaxID=1180 RepID=UPI002FF85C3D
MPVVEAPPPLLAAEPPGGAFPAGGWKRGFKEFQLKLTLIGSAVPLRVYFTRSGNVITQHLYRSQLESVDLDSYSIGDRHFKYSVRSPQFLTLKNLFLSNYSISVSSSLSIDIYRNTNLIL